MLSVECQSLADGHVDVGGQQRGAFPLVQDKHLDDVRDALVTSALHKGLDGVDESGHQQGDPHVRVPHPVQALVVQEADGQVHDGPTRSRVLDVQRQFEGRAQALHYGVHLEWLGEAGGHRCQAGLQGLDVGFGCSQTQTAQVHLEGAVHGQTALTLPQRLVHVQLGLLGYVEAYALGQRWPRSAVPVIKGRCPLQDLHHQAPSLGGHDQSPVLTSVPAKADAGDHVGRLDSAKQVLVPVKLDFTVGQAHQNRLEASGGEVHGSHGGDGSGKSSLPQLLSLKIEQETYGQLADG